MEKILTGISKFKKKIRFSREFGIINKLIKSSNVNTICHKAMCPNIEECFKKRKLTFLIMGDICTRNCGFCNVKTGIPERIDKEEPQRICGIVKELNLKYVVITSVTRDDLDDGGCSVFLDTIERLKQMNPGIKTEILIPDFKNNRESLEKIALSGADVIGHNIETVEELYPEIRPEADFKISLKILKSLKEINSGKIIKSGFMVGLGEEMRDIHELLNILYENNVDVVTVGQYFQPSLSNIPVKKMYSDEEFRDIENYGKKIGYKYISSGRFVRSSYYAEEIFKKI